MTAEALRGLSLWAAADAVGPLEFVVRGDCMHPLLLDGDTVVVESASAGPRLGDLVLLVDHTDCLCLHRLVWRRVCRGEPVFYQKPDNTLRASRVAVRRLLGVAMAVTRQGRVLLLREKRNRLVSRCLGLCHVIAALASAVGRRLPLPRTLSEVLDRLVATVLRAIGAFAVRWFTWSRGGS